MIAAALLACALNVHPTTLEAIIRVEFGGAPYALHANGAVTQPAPAASAEDAAATARRFIAAGYNVDIGIMQVNSRNLRDLNMTIEDALNPCRNIAGGATILADDYARAVPQFGEGKGALLAALSAYNTGTWDRGFANGYVSRVLGTQAIVLASTKPAAPAVPPPPNPYTADTLVYSRVTLNIRIE